MALDANRFERSAFRECKVVGFGKLFKKQDQLTSLSNSLTLQSGQARASAASQEADLMRKQGDMLYDEAQTEKALAQREAIFVAGSQEQEYLASGVNLMGTPLAVANETRRLGQMKVDAIEKRSTSLRDLAFARAGMVEQGGMADLLTSKGAAEMNTYQNEINQISTRGNFYRSLFGGLASNGLSILGARTKARFRANTLGAAAGSAFNAASS